MDDFSALHDAERELLEALNRHGVRFMLVGLSAAVLQGANTATRAIDIWFEDLTAPPCARRSAPDISRQHDQADCTLMAPHK